uniref:Uncharacterized protein n=1 Tax=Rousettus aegyptiacus TaxID=9407 RepID=A0A7J8JBE2_ROUAE|nr:hypothetical protein HJG63_001672 [Rousettus aegyptiacus]
MKTLEVLSPVKNSTVSLDLLNLYVVNQISCQKKISETARKPIHVNMKRDIKMPLRKHNLELPMSPPCVPSNLCIDDIENNIHYERLGNKEELGPVRSSQVMDSYRMFKPQFNRIENCSFTSPSFSAELSSKRHITKQNFIPRIALSPQKVAYEKPKEQLSNVNCSNSLVSELNENQDALSPSYKTQFGTLFERLNSPGNRNFLTGRCAVVMGEDLGSTDERRQSDSITEKQSVQDIWGENRKEVSNFLEDMNHPNSSLLPEKMDPLINENLINLLSMDQQRIKKTFDKCSYESYPEKRQPNRNCQKEYSNNERNNLSTYFEKDCYLPSSEKKGKFEMDYQEKTSQIEIQKYPVNHMGNIPLEGLHSKQSWNFGLDENLVEGGGMCSLKGTPTSTKKICQYNNLDSSQSSQSASYSPRPTDSCFSSSSEMPSEDEDQMLQQIEDSNRRPTKTEETTNNFYLERMTKLPHNRIIENSVEIHKQKSFPKFSMKNNTDELAQSPCNSTHILQNKTSNNCILQVIKCEACVQTESEPVMEEKIDAAIQCDIISKCKCGSDVSLYS